MTYPKKNLEKNCDPPPDERGKNYDLPPQNSGPPPPPLNNDTSLSNTSEEPEAKAKSAAIQTRLSPTHSIVSKISCETSPGPNQDTTNWNRKQRRTCRTRQWSQRKHNERVSVQGLSTSISGSQRVVS